MRPTASTFLLVVLLLVTACSSPQRSSSNDERKPVVESSEVATKTPRPSTERAFPSPESPATGSTAPEESTAREGRSSIDQDPSGSRVLSNDGTYLITYTSQPQVLPLNEPFSIEVKLYRPETGERIDDSAIRIEADADMPAHRHGMVRVPRVTKSGPGEFRVDGMMMHMPGYWQLYVDVTRNGITERAQFDVDLD